MKVEMLPIDYEDTINRLYVACRTCYSAGTPDNMYKNLKNTQDDNKKKVSLLRYVLDSGHHCYDDKTEVLTSNGFKPWSDITYNDKLASIDDEGNLVGYETPKDIIVQDYDGMMYHFKNNKVDLMVTPEHRLYCSLVSKYTRKNPKFQVIRANEVVGKGKHKKEIAFKPIRFKCFTNTKLSGVYNPLNLSEEKIIPFNKFVGFFIGDGYTELPRKSPIFHIKKIRKINYLKGLCKELGFKLVNNKNNKYSVFFDGLGEYCNKVLYNENREKIIPNEYLQCSQDIISAILDGLVNSDGYNSTINSDRPKISYYTTSYQVSERVQELFFLTGGRTTFSIKKSKSGNSKSCYEVRRCCADSNNLPLINDSRHSHDDVKVEHYKGKIYCATVSTGLLVVRRGEKKSPVISGNSTLEHISLTFLISGVSRALSLQLARHRICSISQQSQRYCEFKDGVFDYVTPRKINNNGDALKVFENTMSTISDAYKKLVNLGISAEDARSVLPNACTTNLTWSCNLRELMHICNERLCTCAQEEIRMLFIEIRKQVTEQLPFLKDFLVPKCEMLGYCNEPRRTCGRKKLKEEVINHN